MHNLQRYTYEQNANGTIGTIWIIKMNIMANVWIYIVCQAMCLFERWVYLHILMYGIGSVLTIVWIALNGSFDSAKNGIVLFMFFYKSINLI